MKQKEKYNIRFWVAVSLAFIMAFASCNDDTWSDNGSTTGIEPTAVLGGMKTRAGEGVINPSENTKLDISIIRIDQDAAYAYPSAYNSINVSGPLEATLKGDTENADAKVTFSVKQYYQENNRLTKLIGLYPAITGTNWTPATGIVTYTMDGQTDIMATQPTEGGIAASGNATQPHLKFAHMLTQIRVQVYAENERVRKLWGNIREVLFEDMPTTCKLTLPTLTGTAYPTTQFDETGDGSFELINPGSLAEAEIPTIEELKAGADTAMVGSVLLPPVDDKKLSFNVIGEVNGEVYFVPIELPKRNYLAGTAYEVKLKLTASQIKPEDVTVAPWEDAPKELNGDAGTNDVEPDANCYMVKPRSGVVFGVKQANKYWYPDKAIKKDDVVTAEVLWSDYPGLVECSVVGTGYNARIRVSANPIPTARGNAVVVAKVGGEIRWSWHIWVTDEVADVNGWMDRNLGAASANPEDGVKTFGLVYQWGRKDPFPGADIADEGGYPILYNADQTYFTLEEVSESQILDWMVENPIVFISVDMLGGMSPTDDYWAVTGEKSLYDPCPAGYRVPAQNRWPQRYAGHYEWKGNGAIVSTYGGWYPATGWRISAWQFEFTKEGVTNWSANPALTVGAKGAYLGIPNSTEWANNKETPRNYGLPVRCMRMDGVEEERKEVIPMPEANCYIVKPGGAQMVFPVSQSDNYWAVEDPTKILAADEEPEIVILWADNPSLVTCERVGKGPEAMVRVVSNANPTSVGNVLIGLKRGTEILWSWHIWVVDDVCRIGKFLDRNLGAVSANPADGIKTYGLLYQWGRKDPFPGAGAKTGTTEKTLYNATDASFTYAMNTSTVAALGAPTRVNAQKTLSWTVQNPMTFVTSTSYTWMTGSAATDTHWETGKKTLHDPCPPGYRVASRGDLGSAVDWTSISWNATNLGRDTGDLFGGWYSAAGRRNYSSGALENVGTYAYVWESTVSSATNAYYMYFYNNVNVYPENTYYRAIGASIRCIAEI